MVHSVRSIGSAALNYGMVAGGGLDLYWYIYSYFQSCRGWNLNREIGCWPWDVCAGIVIAEEAGCVVTGSHDAFAASSSTKNFGIVTEEILTGRKYVVVRAIGDTKVNLMSIIYSFLTAYLCFQPGGNRFRRSKANHKRILWKRGGYSGQLTTPLSSYVSHGYM